MDACKIITPSPKNTATHHVDLLLFPSPLGSKKGVLQTKDFFLIVHLTDDYGYVSGTPLEDQFDFSLEYDIVIKWVVANLTCQTAMHKDTRYACRSSQSYCLNVTHGEMFMGYHCKCSPGFQGNP
ncbi:hypothetical protein ACQ4PT_007714 [Festuca glaucescens]